MPEACGEPLVLRLHGPRQPVCGAQLQHLCLHHMLGHPSRDAAQDQVGRHVHLFNRRDQARRQGRQRRGKGDMDGETHGERRRTPRRGRARQDPSTHQAQVCCAHARALPARSPARDADHHLPRACVCPLCRAASCAPLASFAQRSCPRTSCRHLRTARPAAPHRSARSFHPLILRSSSSSSAHLHIR